MPIHLIKSLIAATLLATTLPSSAKDTERGKMLHATRCGACHSMADNGPGPRLQGLFGCTAGTQPGFDYSEALKGSGIAWSDGTLDKWLANPNALVPGNKMVVQMANDPIDRADLIAYLQIATKGAGSCAPS